MKMLKVVGAKEVALISDLLNQLIVQKLSVSQYSVADLSIELNIPALKVWRRMQRLLKAKLVEVSDVRKIGNLEQKLYRATAIRYAPPEFLEFKPNDPNIQAAYQIFAKIQNEMTTFLSTSGDIPKEVNPIDFALYVNMQSFIQLFEMTNTRENVQKIKQMLENYENENLCRLPKYTQ